MKVGRVPVDFQFISKATTPPPICNIFLLGFINEYRNRRKYFLHYI